MEHPLFTVTANRRPGDIPVRDCGAAWLSLGDTITHQRGEWMTVGFAGDGPPWVNPRVVAGPVTEPTIVKSLA